jgi:hypothetical protein
VAVLVLWVDERYRAVLGAQFAMIVGAPLFVWVAGRFGLVPAAFVLGGSRLAVSLIGYGGARRAYDVRFPWRFTARITLVSMAMALILSAIRQVWGTSVVEASALPVLGVVVVLVGLRVLQDIGPNELEVLQRVSVPGKHLLVRWLSPTLRTEN